ncbi:8436_t:CDS:2 [Entrophospora sp. SA101]|nr:8489_t:CDS:2 [Entrophospora sp. SA101]CAJ0626864.1 8436_t:CDS:2 [Entrophospora sp. SA101]CAJ0915649.1 17528_t:CDS:2 [Entrophospora sp. SA101]
MTLLSQISISSNDSFKHNQISINDIELTASIQESNQSRSSLGEEREGFLSGVREETRENSYRIFFLRVFLITILLAIIILCIILLINPPNGRKEKSTTFFNGTHEFNPTVILISFDGFRWDYLDRNKTPTIQKFIDNGIRAKYLEPVFPSVTFANHYTIVTGLYPESHGIVGNEFYDPDLNDDFYYTKPEKSFDSKWWGVIQNQKSAVSMWVGGSSVIKGYRPTYNMPYSGNVLPEEKVNQVIDWLDLEKEQRPTFITAYMNHADAAGHLFGPFSKELDQTLGILDNMIADLLSKLSSRNLTDIVNIIIVSDHGMAQVIPSNIIYLDNFFDITKVRVFEGYPLAGIRPYNDSDIPEIYSSLVEASENQLWNCYLREEIPERYHYRNSKRIAPIFCIPPVGWVLTSHRDFAVLHNGSHGYDNQAPEMRGIFLASGPYFKEKLSKLNTNVVDPFSNLEVYNIVANVLNLEPAPNNANSLERILNKGVERESVTGKEIAIYRYDLQAILSQITKNCPSKCKTRAQD